MAIIILAGPAKQPLAPANGQRILPFLGTHRCANDGGDRRPL
jgi:hypothetical protein